MSVVMDIYKLRPQERLYIALDDLDLSWAQVEMQCVKRLWAEGVSLDEIAKRMKRDENEVACLIMDLRRKRQIKCRPQGVYGL